MDDQEFMARVEGFFDTLDSMPDEVRDMLLSKMRDRVWEMTGDREKVDSLMKAYEQHKLIKNLNLQVVNVLGSMKGYLSKFDEKNNSTDRAVDNLKFFFTFMRLFGLPMQNLASNLSEFKDEWDKV